MKTILILPIIISSFASAATILNPSFESITLDPGQPATYQSPYAGWGGVLYDWSNSVSPTNTVVIIGNSPGYAYATPYGNYAVDLTGSSNVAGGWIETSISSLNMGESYVLTFFFGTSTDWTSGGTPGVTVSLDGGSVQNFTHAPSSQIEWTQINYTFTASAASATLRFTDSSTGGNGFASVDNLNIAPASIPEPTTYLLSCIGVIAMMLTRYRI